MRMRHICTVGLLMLAAGLLAACDKKPEANVSEEMNSIENEQDGEEGEMGGLAKLLGVTSDKITYTVDNISVDAAVDIPDVPKAAVYHQVLRPMSANEVKNVAAGLFDAGSMKPVRPFAAYSESELMEAEQELKEQALAARKEARDAGRSDWKDASFVFDYWLNDVRQLLDGYDKAPETWEENAFYSVLNDWKKILIYEGTINGLTYFLMAVEQEKTVNLYLYKEGEPWSQIKDFYHEDWSERTRNDINDITYGKNQCSMTLEEAKKTAEGFLEKYGFQDMLMAEGKDAYFQSAVFINYDEEAGEESEDEAATDTATSYSFHFVRSYEGIPVDYRDNVQLLGGSPMDVYEGPLETYRVIVNDDGVCYMEIGAMYQVTEALTDDSALLSFEQINNIAKEQLPQTGREEQINQIDFRYRNLEYDGELVLMPVWIYSHSSEMTTWMGESRDNILVLNAVDGSVVAADKVLSK